MSMNTTTKCDQPLSAAALILLAGGTAGAIDLVYATARTVAAGGSALRPWKGVAAALFGVNAVASGGDAMAIVGVCLHFLITIVAATIFYVAARRYHLLVRYPLISGICFGTLFFLVMNYIILPLSVIGKPLYVGSPATMAFAVVSHIIMIGLPIAFIVSWRTKRASSRALADRTA